MKDLLKLNPPAFLVVSTTAGFFALVTLLFFRDIPEGTQDILYVLLGGVAGQWASIIQYHFGSSSGSAHKTTILDKISGTGDGGSSTTNATIKTEVTHVST